MLRFYVRWQTPKVHSLCVRIKGKFQYVSHTNWSAVSHGTEDIPNIRKAH